MNQEVLKKIQTAHDERSGELLLGSIKGRYPFVTDLAGLDTSDTISVLFANSALKSSMPQWALDHFEFVLWFDAGEFWSGQNLAHLDKLEFPDLKSLIVELSRIFDPNQIRLVALEEQFVRFTADMRDQLKIPGPKPKDVEPYTDKMAVKKAAEKYGIRTAKYTTIYPKDLLNNEPNLQKLENLIPYPMFLKPAHGVGGAGTDKILNREELLQWLKRTGQEDSPYLFEEYIDHAKEVSVLGFCQNGKLEFYHSVIMTREDVTIFDMLKYGTPLPLYCTDPRSDPKACEYLEFACRAAAQAFPPLENSLYFMQILTTPRGEHVLNELACRTPGAAGSPLFSNNTGISTETVHIMGQVKRINLDQFSKYHTGEHFGLIAYPKTKSTESCRLVGVPKGRLTSRVHEVWVAREGQTLRPSSNVGDIVCRIYLWNKIHDELLKDMDYLFKNYNPVVD